MAVNIRATRVAAQTAGGTQDITISGFGTPKAALFIATWADTDGVAEDEALIGIGATDGTRQVGTSINSEHGQTSTDTKSDQQINDTECLALLSPGSFSPDGEANFDSWITDGVRINWGDAPSKGWLITAILFGGDDVSARFDQIQPTTTTQTYSSMGFEADVVIPFWTRNEFGGSLNNVALSFGLVHNDGAGAITQRCVILDEQDNQTAGVPQSRLLEDACAGDVDGTHEVSLSNFGASGFDYIKNSGVTSYILFFLGLKFTNRSSWVGTVDSPTATGNDAQTGPGFTPQAVLLGLSAIQAVDVAETDADAGSFGVSFFNDTEEFCNAIAIEDAAATTNTQSLSDDQAINLAADDGTQTWAASFVSMDANGWTLNFSATDGAARKWIGLAVEGAAAADFAPHGLRSLNDGVRSFPSLIQV